MADLDEVRKELSKGRTEPCLERTRFNRGQLLGLAELITEMVRGLGHEDNTRIVGHCANLAGQ
ncbi:MAG: hypothetical protein GY750_02865 [Lentisphaerae bacterium]|nr:hypothetical protein [Lentisphaerota bacterium]